MSPREYLEFVWLPTFERSAAGLLDEVDRLELENALLEAPDRGAVMPGTGGFRKLRWAVKGKGKRGGARIIYIHVPQRERIYMVMAYAKGVQEVLSGSQRSTLRTLAAAIKKGSSR